MKRSLVQNSNFLISILVVGKHYFEEETRRLAPSRQGSSTLMNFMLVIILAICHRYQTDIDPVDEYIS